MPHKSCKFRYFYIVFVLVSFISRLVFCSVFSLFLFGFIFSESLVLVRIFGVVWKQLKTFISITYFIRRFVDFVMASFATDLRRRIHSTGALDILRSIQEFQIGVLVESYHVI